MGIIVIVVIVLLTFLAVGFVSIYNYLQRLSVKVEEAASGIDVALEKRFDLLSEQLAAVKKYLTHEYETLTDISALRSGTANEDRRMEQQKVLAKQVLRDIDKEIDRQSAQMESIRHDLVRGSFRRNRHRRNAVRQSEMSAQREEQANQRLAQIEGRTSDTVNQKIGVLASVHRDLSGMRAGIDALYEQYPTLNGWLSMEQFQRAVFNSEEHLQAARRLYNSNVSLYNQMVRSIPWCIVAGLLGMHPVAFYEVEDQKRKFTVNFD